MVVAVALVDVVNEDAAADAAVKDHDDDAVDAAADGRFRSAARIQDDLEESGAVVAVAPLGVLAQKILVSRAPDRLQFSEESSVDSSDIEPGLHFARLVLER